MRVAKHAQEILLFLLGHQAFERPRLALQGVNAFGLLPRLVHRQHQAPVEELLVYLHRCRRQEQHDRAFHMVFLRLHAARGGILAGAGDGELTFRLQQLHRVAGLLRAFLLHDGEDLMLEVRLAQVVEALPGHGAVLDALLLREHRQHRLHDRALSRRAGALDDDRQRLVQFARGAGEIGGQAVQPLACQAARRESPGDPGNEIRRFQEGKGFRPFGGRHLGCWFLVAGCQGGVDPVGLRLFHRQ